MSSLKVLACQNAKHFVDNITTMKKKDILYNSISNFEDKEMLVTIKDRDELKNQDVLVVQSLSNNVNDAIIELIFTLDIVRFSSPKSIKLLITYMGYSRQDVPELLNEPFSAKIIANLLSFNYISKIYVVDIHAGQTMGFFNIPSVNIELNNVMDNIITKNFNLNNVILISPNSDYTKKMATMSERLGVEYSVALKYRPSANANKLLSIVGADVKDKDCIIIDDIIDSANTITNLSDKLSKQGAKSINVFATHGILSNKSLDRLKASPINKIFICNTIDISKKIPYIKQLEEVLISDYVLDIVKGDEVY